jgi:hypothetical protein
LNERGKRLIASLRKIKVRDVILADIVEQRARDFLIIEPRKENIPLGEA